MRGGGEEGGRREEGEVDGGWLKGAGVRGKKEG